MTLPFASADGYEKFECLAARLIGPVLAREGRRIHLRRCGSAREVPGFLGGVRLERRRHLSRRGDGERTGGRWPRLSRAAISYGTSVPQLCGARDAAAALSGDQHAFVQTHSAGALALRDEHSPAGSGRRFADDRATVRCIGTKIVNMKPMTRGEYNAFRGWAVPADENPSDEGYLVEYLDGGAPNTPHFAGYVSWSPKAQADAAYRAIDGLTFGLAVEALKKGARVARPAGMVTACSSTTFRRPHIRCRQARRRHISAKARWCPTTPISL